MALSAKSEAVKHVPWFSLSEWHQVYKQTYSNDTVEQTRAYETLLMWKARMPKLPVGVECTLSVIQVCLRDREWSLKIDEGTLPMYYENDLCLMYSTAIMRFLNQISNVGHTKQTSMFQIARQLKIPEWIVNLRHDAAHGHELPSVGALRMAANVLLTWLHEEYWTAEAKGMEERYEGFGQNGEGEKTCESRAFVVFFELWTAIGLYARADYETVADLPDTELRKTLLNLCTVLPESPLRKEKVSRESINVINEDDYLLSDAQRTLFSEISALLGVNKSIPNIEQVVIGILFDCEAFLPGPDIIGIYAANDETIVDTKMNSLPRGMTDFWGTFVALVHEKKLLDELVWRLLDFVNSPTEEASKRLVASLWIKSICQSLLKLRAAQCAMQSMEHSLDNKHRRVSTKQMIQKVRTHVNKTNPELATAMWLNLSSDIPAFLKDLNFATDLLLNANSYTKHFVQPILDLVTPAIPTKCKDNLLKLVKIHTRVEGSKKTDGTRDPRHRTYEIEDLMRIVSTNAKFDETQENGSCQRPFEPIIADRTIRNGAWDAAPPDYDWAACPFGVLPWQMDSLEILEPQILTQPRSVYVCKESDIVPGLLNDQLLRTESRVNWDNVLRKKRRMKRKRQHGDSDVMIDRAIEIVKRRQR